MFKLEFETRNAAFDDENDGNAPAEIQRILCEIGDRAYVGRTNGAIMDVNGNRIGSWEYTQD